MFISIRRAFTCESKSKNCSVSGTELEAKPIAPSNAELCITHHHCSSCIGYTSAKSVASITAATAVAVDAAIAADVKKPKIPNKKPLLKSIILSTNNNNNCSPSVANIKRELDDSNECNKSICPIEFSSMPMTKTPQTKSQPIDMQFTDTKKTKQINSYFKSNDHFVQQNERSYSPPLPANHRLASMVSSDTVANTVVTMNQSRRSHSSRDRKCSKKRKKRRRSRSKDSRRSR